MGIVYGSFASWVLLCKPWSLQVEFQVAESKPLLPFSFCSVCCVFQVYGGLLCLNANWSSSRYVTMFINWSKERQQAFAVPGHLLANRRSFPWRVPHDASHRSTNGVKRLQCNWQWNLQQLQESIWSALVALADSHMESHDACWGLLLSLLDISSGKAWVLHAMLHHTVNMARSGVVQQKFFPSSLHLLKQETFRRYELATLLTLC